MPIPLLNDVDLSDPSPPVPGNPEREAVHARARTLVRRRRAWIGVGAVAVVALVAGSVILLSNSGGAPRVATIAVKSSTQAEPGSKITVVLQNDSGRFVGVADESGTVRFGDDIVPGTYNVLVTVESAPAESQGGVDIGSAVVTYRTFPEELAPGVNTINLDDLVPVGPTTP